MAAAKFNEIAPGQAALKQKQGSLQFIAGPDASQVSSPIQLFDVQVDCDADPWAGLDLIWTNLPTTIPALLGRELADGRLEATPSLDALWLQRALADVKFPRTEDLADAKYTCTWFVSW